jgi:hypothetical protein
MDRKAISALVVLAALTSATQAQDYPGIVRPSNSNRGDCLDLQQEIWIG